MGNLTESVVAALVQEGARDHGHEIDDVLPRSTGIPSELKSNHIPTIPRYCSPAGKQAPPGF
jgi:hypothetical protein